MQAASFMSDMEARWPAVAAHFRDNWLPCATHWAHWGRADILDMNCHTNNLLERFFGMLKYDYLLRKTQYTLADLADTLLFKVVPAYMHRRVMQLVGREAPSTIAVCSRRREQMVQSILADPGSVYRDPTAQVPPGHAVVSSEAGDVVTTVLGDLSCSCDWAGGGPARCSMKPVASNPHSF